MQSRQSNKFKTFKRIAGVSLVELMLVFAVAGNFLVLGVRLYQNYKQYVEIDAVKSNVDLLFMGMQGFYRANCYGKTGPDGVRIENTGLLNPQNIPPPPTNFPIEIGQDLVGAGYINRGEARPLMYYSQYVDSGRGYFGYIGQFNKRLLSQTSTEQRHICLTENCTTPVDIGEIYIWQAQISIKLSADTLGGNIVNLLGADCVSALGPDGRTVMPCSANQTGEYAVFSRLPTGLMTQGQSTYWPTNPTITQFTQMYNTTSMLLLTDGSKNASQYFLCTN